MNSLMAKYLDNYRSKCCGFRSSRLLAATCILIASFSCVISQNRNSDTKSIVNSYPILYEDGSDNYLLLSDDELVNNAEILRYLSSSSKEEVEEILDGNPMIQNQLLDRVTKIVRQRKSRNRHPGSSLQTQVAGSVSKGPVRVPSPYLRPSYVQYDDDDDDDDAAFVRRPNKKKDKKLLLLKAKLKKKAMKLFKIGAKLKKKILKMKKKKAKKGQGGFFRIANRNRNDNDVDDVDQELPDTRRPRFRFKISTS